MGTDGKVGLRIGLLTHQETLTDQRGSLASSIWSVHINGTRPKTVGLRQPNPSGLSGMSFEAIRGNNSENIRGH